MGVGKEELGNATIYGGGINPLQVLMSQTQQRQRQQAEQQNLAIKQRDKLIDDLDKHSPDKVWDPFYGEINQITQQHVRDYASRAIQAGVPIPKIQSELNRRYGEVNTEVARANMHKETFMDAKNQLKQNADLYNDRAKQSLNDVFFEGPNARKIHDINVDVIPGQVFDNPDNFNKQNVFMKFMKELPERTNQYYTQMWNPLGQQYNIQDTKTKLGFQTDPKGNVVMDPRTGMPKISMTDDVYIQAKQDPFISKILAKEVPDGNMAKEREYLTAMLEGYDPKEAKSRIQMGFKDTKKGELNYIFGSGGFGYRNQKADLDKRDQFLERATEFNNGKDQLGYFNSLTKDLKASYSTTNEKGQSGKFIKVEYVSGMPQTDSEGNQVFNMFGGSKSKASVYLPLNNADERRQAKVTLSRQMDEIEKKTALGEEFPVYLDEKRKNEKPKTIPGFTKGKVIPGFSTPKTK